MICAEKIPLYVNSGNKTIGMAFAMGQKWEESCIPTLQNIWLMGSAEHVAMPKIFPNWLELFQNTSCMDMEPCRSGCLNLATFKTWELQLPQFSNQHGLKLPSLDSVTVDENISRDIISGGCGWIITGRGRVKHSLYISPLMQIPSHKRKKEITQINWKSCFCSLPLA